MYITSLSMAANCCLECQASQAEEEKACFRRECFSYLKSVVESAYDSYEYGLIEEDERDDIERFVLDLQGICRKCKSESLIAGSISSKWVNPTRESLMTVQEKVLQVEENKKRRKRVKKGVKVEGNLYRFNFRPRRPGRGKK